MTSKKTQDDSKGLQKDNTRGRSPHHWIEEEFYNVKQRRQLEEQRWIIDKLAFKTLITSSILSVYLKEVTENESEIRSKFSGGGRVYYSFSDNNINEVSA